LLHSSYTSDETVVSLKKTDRHIRWHKEGVHDNNQVIVHPYDGAAWKTLDNFDADFARYVRNVCIGLATHEDQYHGYHMLR
jgi:hypothetical protein